MEHAKLQSWPNLGKPVKIAHSSKLTFLRRNVLNIVLYFVWKFEMNALKNHEDVSDFVPICRMIV